MSLENRFDPGFTARLALREKQIQQSYRPIIGVHKWFARRPGTVFRNLLLAEFNGDEPIGTSYWRGHSLHGVIADPFMGGGTPLYEANRLGFSVVGADVNPMAYWIVRQSLSAIDLTTFVAMADEVARDVDLEVGEFYATHCNDCGQVATVKYFLWVKIGTCPICDFDNDLFPGYLLAEATRHPKHVVLCAHCGALNEFDSQPSLANPEPCAACGQPVHVQGVAHRNRVRCRRCATEFAYPPKPAAGPPRHRLCALEYHCDHCKRRHEGRFFKRPDQADLDRSSRAAVRFARMACELPIPDDPIPGGDETDRLHRWGYRFYRELFNDRQLLGLGILLRRICAVSQQPIRHALLTVFSDFLRYQNLLCRYDTYALKCQDVFSVHGFPVGLIQCENNLLGIPRVGSGSFRHFVEKYARAKEYCAEPFETQHDGTKKRLIAIPGERIEAELVERFPESGHRQAWLHAAPATSLPLPPRSLDGVFTDPPYFDNVQYAELMDFCYAWLRRGLHSEIAAFVPCSTRSSAELTGNVTLGRDLAHFTEGLSAVFCYYADALKPGAPFVFTYHHNDPNAYVPLVVAILDAQLDCTATLPVPAEMGASLHIARTGSSILDSVFVCRDHVSPRLNQSIEESLERDAAILASVGIRVTDGDLRCLRAGHTARVAINRLRASWDAKAPLSRRVALASQTVKRVGSQEWNSALNGLATTQPDESGNVATSI